MFATLGLIAGLGTGLLKPQPMDHLRLYRELAAVDGNRISVWLDRTSPYGRGDRAKVYVSADHDAYLTVLRIDTDGRVRVLFPQDPWDDNFVTGGRTFEVEDRDGAPSFRVDDAPGEGYVFAIVSDNRFDYSSILTDRDHWDYRAIADGQVRGDPYVAVTDLAERITPQGDYDYDLAQYDVERHYDYPRFVCYDCHAFVPYYAWNPYAQSCVRFRVVIYDDPYYYPYRYYGGRRTVVVRPRRAEPRYVFVDNTPGHDYVTRIPNRPRREDLGGTGGDEQMRPRRGEDVGGRGTIPAPGVPGRRIIRDRNDQGQPAQPELRPLGRDGDQADPRRPDQPDQRRPDRRDQPDVNRNPPGLQVQPRPPQDRPNQDRPNQDRPRRDDPKPDRRPDPPPQRQPDRPPPQRQPDRPPPERRAEPQRQPDRPPPERRAEPARDNGGSRGGSPELRRRKP